MNKNNELSDSQKKKAQIIIVFLLVVFAVCFFRDKNKQKDFILKDYSFTSGKIIKAGTNSEGITYLKYQYRVNVKNYEEEINPHIHNYDDCPEDFRLCNTVKFWVIYSNSKPELSMINYSLPIQTDEEPQMTRGMVPSILAHIGVHRKKMTITPNQLIFQQGRLL